MNYCHVMARYGENPAKRSKRWKVLAQIEQEAQEDVQRYEELQRSMQELEA